MKLFFDEQIAKKIGVEEAIFLAHIEFWVKRNAANKENFEQGYFWTYNSRAAFSRLFTFWTDEQLKRIINKLLEANLLKKGEFNKLKYDRTNWYTSLRNEFLTSISDLLPNQGEEVESPNGGGEINQPIPDINPDTLMSTDTPKKAVSPIAPDSAFPLTEEETPKKPQNKQYEVALAFMAKKRAELTGKPFSFTGNRTGLYKALKDIKKLMSNERAYEIWKELCESDWWVDKGFDLWTIKSQFIKKGK